MHRVAYLLFRAQLGEETGFRVHIFYFEVYYVAGLVPNGREDGQGVLQVFDGGTKALFALAEGNLPPLCAA